ncbi:hypothetical protein TREES_T100021505 [Tupaia chinensis]|uniref:Uncharacterized protein n=1 Tax=Tupaia chinensis TaxID=246437 RepID=L9KHZ7_TUPCH|nr:hypothetical protein TREES_T100021505 [Tupaia chinensis]
MLLVLFGCGCASDSDPGGTSASDPPYTAPRNKKRVPPNVVWEEAPDRLSARGHPRLTWDRWVQGEAGDALGHTCSRPDAPDLTKRRLEPVATSALGDVAQPERRGEQLGRAGKDATEIVNPGEPVLIAPGLFLTRSTGCNLRGQT